MIEMFTVEPAKLLRLNKGTLSVGAEGDVTIFDPHKEIVVDKHSFYSKSRNTPFHGWELQGAPILTIVAGKIVWQRDTYPPTN